MTIVATINARGIGRTAPTAVVGTAVVTVAAGVSRDTPGSTVPAGNMVVVVTTAVVAVSAGDAGSCGVAPGAAVVVAVVGDDVGEVVDVTVADDPPLPEEGFTVTVAPVMASSPMASSS